MPGACRLGENELANTQTNRDKTSLDLRRFRAFALSGWLVAMVLGVALLFAVLQESAQSNFTKEFVAFAEEIVKEIDNLDPPPSAVAVTAFTDNGGDETQLGRLIATQLTVAIGKKDHRFRLSDRLGLAQVLDELKLAATGMIDPSDAPRLGEITPVNMLITGTSQSTAGKILVSAKVVDATTAEIRFSFTLCGWYGAAKRR